jgi:hypothetical protein
MRNPTLTVTRKHGYAKSYPLALEWDRAYEWAMGYAFGEYSLHGATWTDTHIPRTERPVRFGWKWHVGGISGDGTCWVCLSPSGCNGWRKAHPA